ncbi:Alpha-1,2-mannosyltransferase MNN21 [Exophiala dermatitidis]
MLLPRPRTLSRSWHRRKGLFVAQLLGLICFVLFVHSLLPRPVQEALPAALSAPTDVKPTNPLLKSQAAFWRDLYHIISRNDPNCEHPPEAVVPQKLDIGFDPSHNHQRPDILFMDTADIRRMREAHSNFVGELKKSPPKMPYEPDTRGIVMTAGFEQLPVLVISLRMLRRTWSLLPVEVFLADAADYDAKICNEVLPTLNAKCVIFADIFQAAESRVSIERFQYKIMSVLFSSFEEVLLIDSDAFPLYDPLDLFLAQPFNRTGMVVWPDFWYASESPYYFEIANIKDIPPLNTRSAVESGELMFSKSKHSLGLMLATYYNFYGPNYYYPLLSQGAPGEGDKETFAWAATAVNEPFYPVFEPVKALGRIDSSGNFIGSAMAQHDPRPDYAIAQDRWNEHHQKTVTKSTGNNQAVKPFFIHANFPKFNPATIFGEQTRDFSAQVIGSGGPTRDSNGTWVRCWMDPVRAVEMFGFDVEKRFWEEIKGTACEYEHQFGCWKGKKGICDRVKDYWNEVFETPQG